MKAGAVTLASRFHLSCTIIYILWHFFRNLWCHKHFSLEYIFKSIDEAHVRFLSRRLDNILSILVYMCLVYILLIVQMAHFIYRTCDYIVLYLKGVLVYWTKGRFSFSSDLFSQKKYEWRLKFWLELQITKIIIEQWSWI